MAYTVPTLDDVHERLLADFRARLSDHDVSRLSDNWKRLRTLAFGIWSLFYAGKLTYDDLFPDTAGENGLGHWGRMLDVARRGATAARKSGALRIWGTAGSTVTSGEELEHESGYAYAVNESVTIPAAGYFDADVVSVDTGAATKLDAGEILSFTSPPAGIETDAELQLDLDEDGEDQEGIGAWRERILDKLAQPGMGGNANDYRAWALAVTGIASAYVYPLRAGRGSVDLAALHSGSGSVRLLSASEISDLQDAIDEDRPVHVKSFRVLTVTAQEQDVEMTVEPRPGSAYAADWDDSTPLAVAAWTAGTRTLQFSTNRPSDMEAGHRIVIQTTAGNGDGAPLVIEELGAAADEVVLAEEPSVAPVAGDTVYAGGGLTAAARDAIIDHIDGLGPVVGSYGTGEWDSDINPRRLEAEVLVLDGIRDCEAVTPAATVSVADSAYPNDDSIVLLVPGEIVVRYG